MKNLIIVKGSKDICEVEVNQIRSVAMMHGIAAQTHVIRSTQDWENLAKLNLRFDYFYLAAHANAQGFGDPDPGGYMLDWHAFAQTICPMNIINNNAVFLLACCRAGIERVAYSIFAGCQQIEYVCGPRWKLTAPDLTAGFHTFVYNVERRGLQPDQAAKRASDATGYDFLWYDRIEVERRPEYKEVRDGIWGFYQQIKEATEKSRSESASLSQP
jgi:hypothetical protein